MSNKSIKAKINLLIDELNVNCSDSFIDFPFNGEEVISHLTTLLPDVNIENGFEMDEIDFDEVDYTDSKIKYINFHSVDGGEGQGDYISASLTIEYKDGFNVSMLINGYWVSHDGAYWENGISIVIPKYALTQSWKTI